MRKSPDTRDILIASYEDVARVWRVCEDAERKLLPWNLGLTSRLQLITMKAVVITHNITTAHENRREEIGDELAIFNKFNKFSFGTSVGSTCLRAGVRHVLLASCFSD